VLAEVPSNRSLEVLDVIASPGPAHSGVGCVHSGIEHRLHAHVVETASLNTNTSFVSKKKKKKKKKKNLKIWQKKGGSCVLKVNS